MKVKRFSKVRILLILILCAVFAVSAYMAVSQLLREKKEDDAFADLITKVDTDRQTGTQSAEEDYVDPEPESEPEAPSEQTQPEQVMLAAYASLFEQNSDLFGWIEIEDTKLNYPVMHTPDDPEFYLHRAFDGSSSNSGVPFLDARCFEGCGNYLVYGHHMKNGTMFAVITSYAKESFWKEHPIIRFDTLYETAEYEVIAAFYSKVYSVDENGAFRYYEYADLSDPERFAEYIGQVKEAAIYNTGTEAGYGDQLLTLSTCEYHTEDGRFVVVARKVRNGG